MTTIMYAVFNVRHIHTQTRRNSVFNVRHIHTQTRGNSVFNVRLIVNEQQQI